MEFLHSFHRRQFAGKPVVASRMSAVYSGYRFAYWGSVHTNPDSFQIAYFFYTNRPSVHVKPVNPHTIIASFWKRSPEWILLDSTDLLNSCRWLKRHFSIQLRHKIRSRLKWELANLKWWGTTLLRYCSSNSSSISGRLDWTAIATRRFPLATTSCSRSIV